MAKQELQSGEKVDLLKLGESIRENPNTILLSVPIFFFAWIKAIIIQNQGGRAGALGHCGIAFKNYYKHNFQWPIFLHLAYFCFTHSARLATGPGLPTVFFKCAETAHALNRIKEAEVYFQKAIKEAKKLKDKPQTAYVEASYARFLVDQRQFKKAQKLLANSRKTLKAAIQKEPTSLYLHIWYTQSLIVTGEYFLALADNKKANHYAQQALKHSRIYDLQLRIQDSQDLLKKIKLASVVGISVVIINLTPVFFPA